jgi:4-hydroxybenzoate polyprenyltransferase
VKFFGLVCVYWVLTTLYSAWLKNKLVIDVMVLAGLYTLRVIAGGAAVDVPVSEWLMAFSMFLFTSLAFAKRYAELARLIDESAAQQLDLGGSLALRDPVPGGLLAEARRPHGRSYRTEDIGLLESIGPASGYISVLVMALYVSSPQVSALYKNGWVLWYICPVLLYWITRIWLVAKRHRLSEDPVVFALRDGVSQVSGVIVAVLMYVAVAL